MEKYERNPKLLDLDSYPKVKKLWQEIKTLSSLKLPHIPDIVIQTAAAEPAVNDIIFLPTPTKERKSGFFRSLSSSNVTLQKRALEENGEANAKRARNEENDPFIVESAAVFSRSQPLFSEPKNVFGISLRSMPQRGKIDFEGIDEDPLDQGASSSLILKRMMADQVAFGVKSRKDVVIEEASWVRNKKEETLKKQEKLKAKLTKSMSPTSLFTRIGKTNASTAMLSKIEGGVENKPIAKSDPVHLGEGAINSNIPSKDPPSLKSPPLTKPKLCLKEFSPASLAALPPSRNWRTVGSASKKNATLSTQEKALNSSPKDANSLVNSEKTDSKEDQLQKDKSWSELGLKTSTPLKRIVERAMSIGARRDDSFVPPNRFVNQRVLKRAASFTLPMPSAGYQEFLSKDEEKAFVNLFGHQEVTHDENDNQTENLCEKTSPKKENDTDIRPTISVNVSAKKSRKTTQPRRIVHQSDDDEEDEVSFEDDVSEQSQVDVNLESRTSKKTKVVAVTNRQAKASGRVSGATTRRVKSSNDVINPKVGSSSKLSKEPGMGWDSASVNKNRGGNFRAFNLKSKGNGNGSSSKMGKSRFHKTKKLESYNYKKSDGKHLLHGYDEVDDANADDTVLDDIQAQKVVDFSSFIYLEGHPDNDANPEDNCTISSQYDAVNNGVQVNLIGALKALTGHTSFRPGQLQIIKQILSCQSSLFILPTGGGKSLTYQVPAFILRCIPKKQHSMALVISPTISLMMDQLQGLPKGIRGACLSSAEQNSAKTNKVIESVKSGQVDVLFISPERLRSDSFIRLIQNKVLPPISFVCVDEVHCLSEWSHNFRTSYLHLHSSLLQVLNVGCILGLTGTATKSSQESICSMLEIDPAKVVSYGFIRHNLHLTGSLLSDLENREVALLELIRSPIYQKFKSIIVYVMFQVRYLSHFRIKQINWLNIFG